MKNRNYTKNSEHFYPSLLIGIFSGFLLISCVSLLTQFLGFSLNPLYLLLISGICLMTLASIFTVVYLMNDKDSLSASDLDSLNNLDFDHFPRNKTKDVKRIDVMEYLPAEDVKPKTSTSNSSPPTNTQEIVNAIVKTLEENAPSDSQQRRFYWANQAKLIPIPSISKFAYQQVLDVPTSADESTIKNAYHKLALQYHPDKAQDNSTSKEQFQTILDAYEHLTEGEERSEQTTRFLIKNSPQAGPQVQLSSSANETAINEVRRTLYNISNL